VIDESDMRTNLIMVAGYQRRLQNSWEQTRAIAYNVARFGQSNPKKFPKTPQAFWPLPWDEQKEAAPKDAVTEWREHEKRRNEIRAMHAAKNAGEVKKSVPLSTVLQVPEN
jgi:hypothetical protein